MRKKVLIATKLDKIANDILAANGNYEVVEDRSASMKEAAARHPDAYALIVRSESVTPEIIDALPNLKVIIRAGSGYNTIDTKYARTRNIDVMTTPGANSNAVAEEVIAMMLADARHVIAADASTRSGKWEKKQFMGHEIAGKTVGIVGLGNVGQLVAKRLSGFEVRLLGYDPAISNEKAEETGVELTTLEALFGESDYITLHIPENNETRGMINESLLAGIKEDAVLINCARSGIINEAALREAKKNKRLRFLNDVYDKDTEGQKSVSDIADIMLPHLGANTMEANYNAARRAAEQLVEFDERGVTSFIVNRDIPEGLDQAYCELANILARLCRQLSSHDAKLKMIETIFYGALEPYANWLLIPVVAGIWPDFDRSLDYHAARQHLKERGIDYINREADPAKKYGESISINLTSTIDAVNLRRVSVRGTVAENTLMVSRINEFDKLYFEPRGNTVFFLYDDRPGVLGAIGMTLAKAGINIEDVRNPHDMRTNRSLAVMKINQPAPKEVVDRIISDIRAIAAFNMTL